MTDMKVHCSTGEIRMHKWRVKQGHTDANRAVIYLRQCMYEIVVSVAKDAQTFKRNVYH